MAPQPPNSTTWETNIQNWSLPENIPIPGTTSPLSDMTGVLRRSGTRVHEHTEMISPHLREIPAEPLFKMLSGRLGVAFVFNPSTRETEAGSSIEFKISLVYKRVPGQPGIHRDLQVNARGLCRYQIYLNLDLGLSASRTTRKPFSFV